MHIIRAIISISATAASVYLFGWQTWNLALGGFFIFRELVFDSPVEVWKVPSLVTERDEKNIKKSDKRICVVTGASGFVGRNMVKTLVENGDYDIIRAVDIIPPKFENSKVENLQGDITNLSVMKKHLEGAETVFHIASLITLRDEEHHFQRLRRVNVVGAQTVVNACILTGVKKLVYTSSGAVTVDGRKGKLSEKDYVLNPPKLWTGYGITKKDAEVLVLKANGVCGLRTIALRPFALFGEGDALMADMVYKSQTVFDAPNLLSTCYVGNLIEWHLLADKGLTTKPEVVSGKAYFVADDNETPRTKAGLNNLLLRSLNMEHIKSMNSTIIYVLAYLAPIVDWITCGSLKSIMLENNPGALLYSYTEVDLDVSMGMKELGYRRKYTDEDIVKRLRVHYKIGEKVAK